MEVFEDDLTYMALRNVSDDVLKVYVDSSFNVGGQGRSIQGPGNAAGTGWTIESAQGNLAGFGMNSLLNEASISSELWELRGIVEFFKTIKRFRPDLLNQDKIFEINCDNMVLVEYMGKGGGASSIKRLGLHDVRLLKEFQVVTNISFHWVKGHAGHYFNSIADRFARHACTALNSEELNYYERQDYIRSVLMNRGVSWADEVISGPAPAEILERRAAYKARHRKTDEERTAQLELFKDSIFMEIIAKPSQDNSLMHIMTDCELTSTVYMDAPTPNYSKTARALATVSSVLEHYWNSGLIDADRPLTLYGNCGQAGAAVNTIRKGKAPDATQSAVDANVAREIIRLRSIMEGKPVRYLDHALVQQLKASA